jgi:hypothetical protein
VQSALIDVGLRDGHSLLYQGCRRLRNKMDPVIFKLPMRSKSAWRSPPVSAVQHITLLKKWLSLFPAVLPSHEHCTPTLSHPDLHAANIFVNDDDSTSVAAIIDWQGAAIRPLFETVMPDFVNIDTKNLLSGGDLQQPLLPDDFDALDVAQKLEARAEVKKVASNHRFLKLVRQLRPALYASFRLRQMEDLRCTIYYSSHSWSDGLPLLEQRLMSLTAGYNDYIPANTDYPVCPVIFSEEDTKRHETLFILRNGWMLTSGL